MTRQQAQAALSFLARADLKGNEAATLVQVQAAMTRIATGDLLVVERQDYEALVADKEASENG